jgi:hypothetical protein
MNKRENIEAIEKNSKEENIPKTKNKDEVLLSATCSGGAAPKKRVTFCLPFAIDVKGGEKLGS